MEADGTLPATPWRRVMAMAVSSVCQQAGFTSIEPAALSSLTESFISVLKELGRSSKAYSDLACRSDLVVGDVVMALVDNGFNVASITEFAKRRHRPTLPTPLPSAPTKQPPTLQVGEKQNHPAHIPDHLPAFPDSHAYVQTPTHKQPITNYEAVRERAASQKRDMERALTRFIAKTGPVDKLFDSDEQAQFPLIACRSIVNPYLQALDPRDQIFEEEEAYVPRKRKSSPQDGAEQESSAREPPPQQPEGIDNPFLRPPKMPRKRKL
ncbi:transcription initiation factor TFIID subunit 8-like [Amphibalanus amphitrite]|uniref:transcription initiation factor TFIID subunit 8-like n=1 Tax=Amphibalanus amphitrite TaxID=1232801 RepID=UPI001C8FDB7F|nr:transcription initiation factor TFIID subunit 8-like [Amphibalanus amphitrite]XP_043238096.1 transcription initiation factor TFIID subunit 8-like [Amphibalanus amphitrite]XP_043238097.1 transcription initiation factor TFIID subunit 8-like [Amphibalanus amphitrite]XP_043238098.1 transcription initiation factor TFIID subunit 8-like [Amphibalanus amphitrite]XP_043238099.1 transcription initiation factor TFIID subunit 8-like [Amphibalanus amphitrite]XP_043238100.1 transcription initiation facto